MHPDLLDLCVVRSSACSIARRSSVAVSSSSAGSATVTTPVRSHRADSAQGPFAPSERGYGGAGAEGLTEDGCACFPVHTGVGVDENGSVTDGGGLGRAAEFAEFAEPLHVVRAEETFMAPYIHLVEDGSDDLHSAAEDLGCSDSEVRRLLFVYSAKPHEVAASDGRRLFPVQAEVDGDFRDRFVGCVPLDHLGLVAVEP
ncbi:hypothetical protein [Streptomyces spinoverrucosus]|uniref:hypothetical protein n=1 Tax=Streptomyces spinoverrucosus TaxID=284043 RepID=UPI00167B86AC|nr:hypothetical protein [Streptomyces spinoverrucosus]